MMRIVHIQIEFILLVVVLELSIVEINHLYILWHLILDFILIFNKNTKQK